MSEMLIDTDIFVDFLRNNNKAKNFFEKIISGQITGYSSVITEAELFSGKECEISEKKDAVNNLLSLINKKYSKASLAINCVLADFNSLNCFR